MTRKISVDLTDENFEALDKFKESRNMPYSIIINRLLRILCKSPDIKEELITICKSRIRTLYAEMDQVGTFECQKFCDTPTRVLANGRGFLRHGRTPQRAITSPLHPVTSLPLSRLFCSCLF